MAPRPRWVDYLDEEVSGLLERLAEVSQELSGLHSEVAMVRGQERSAKVTGFQESGEPSVTGRERYADMNALHLTTETMKLDGQIKSLVEEKELLLTLIDWKLR